MIKEASREGMPYDSTWLVFDRNGHQKIRQTFSESLAFNPQINIAFTSVCFEYWIYLHFEKSNKRFENCSEVISFIKDHHLSDYQKTSNIFSKVSPNLSTAISNALWLEQQNQLLLQTRNPEELQAFTSFHSLITYLKKISN